VFGSGSIFLHATFPYLSCVFRYLLVNLTGCIDWITVIHSFWLRLPHPLPSSFHLIQGNRFSMSHIRWTARREGYLLSG